MHSHYRLPYAISAALLSLIFAGAVWYVRHRDPLAELAGAVGRDYGIEPRLTGGFLPPSDVGVRRGARDGFDRLSPDARIAIAGLEKTAAADRSPRTLASVAVAYLVSGDADRAVVALEEVVSLTDGHSAWSDLSAAYLVKADRTPARRIEYLARALDAASRSLRIQPSNEARFNRALALQGISPYVGETGPWNDYLQQERDSRWLAIAKAHAARVAPAPDARDRWNARRSDLRERLTASDRAFVEDTVSQFPEASLEFLDQELFVEWARAETSGDRQRSKTTLASAMLLAGAILQVTQDALPSEELELILSAQKDATATRVHAVAEGHLFYAEGVSQYDSDEYVPARQSFDDAFARFTRAASPYAAWAAVQHATILFQQRDLEAANSQLSDVERTARARKYPTLLGRTLWLRGLVHSKNWRLTEALGAFRESASVFEDALEHEYVVSLYGHLADALRTLGEHHESWEYIGKTLEGMSRVRKPTRRYLFVYSASLFASSQELFETALVFQNAALAEAESRVGAFASAEALAERAAILSHLGRGDDARHDLEAASKRIEDIAVGPLKNYAKAEVELQRSDMASAEHAMVSDDGLHAAIDFFTAAEPSMVPRLFLGLGRAELSRRSTDAAERAFGDGIARLEQQQRGLRDEALKISYFDEGWTLFPEMVRLQLARNRPDRAFEYAERSRARLLLAAADVRESERPPSLADVQQQLPPNAALIYYVSLSDRLVTWLVTARGIVMAEHPTGRQLLGRLVLRHLAAITDGAESGGAANDALFAALIRPVVAGIDRNATLIVVPDGDLQRLPFATLRDPATKRYLVEDHALVQTPSASLYVARLARLRQFAATPLASALLIGNPYASGDSNDLLPLPGADREAREAAGFYANHEVVTGNLATRQRFIESSIGADVVHFGGHAYVNPEYPLLSRLTFARGGNSASDALFAHEIRVAHRANAGRRPGCMQYRRWTDLAWRGRSEHRAPLPRRRCASCDRESVGCRRCRD